ncbi:MAG: hypothetical protein KAJ29_08080 [Alphaproteobacteria bacterium]|nr:hypothetical protein [Alphaproteobacteria bacterium]
MGMDDIEEMDDGTHVVSLKSTKPDANPIDAVRDIVEYIAGNSYAHGLDEIEEYFPDRNSIDLKYGPDDSVCVIVSKHNIAEKVADDLKKKYPNKFSYEITNEAAPEEKMVKESSHGELTGIMDNNAQVVTVKSTGSRVFASFDAMFGASRYIYKHIETLESGETGGRFLDRDSVNIKYRLDGSVHVIVPEDVEAERIAKSLEKEYGFLCKVTDKAALEGNRERSSDDLPPEVLSLD